MRQICLSKYFIFCVSEASIKKTSGTEPGFADKELQRAYEIAISQPDDRSAWLGKWFALMMLDRNKEADQCLRRRRNLKINHK
jgi:hypothetical protein